MIAYKFMSSRYVGEFLTKGTVKLGTAHEFRTLEGSKGGRGDENELRHVWDAGGTHHLTKDHPLVVALAGTPPQGIDNLRIGFGIAFNSACIAPILEESRATCPETILPGVPRNGSRTAT
jgi:hypothetical protein